MKKNKTKQINVRLTEEEFEILERMFLDYLLKNLEIMSFPNFLRMILLKIAKRRTKTKEKNEKQS